MNDVLLAKVASILKCLNRVQEDSENENTFRNNITKQDAVVLNLQRACEASIDIANHIVKEKRLGACSKKVVLSMRGWRRAIYRSMAGGAPMSCMLRCALIGAGGPVPADLVGQAVLDWPALLE